MLRSINILLVILFIGSNASAQIGKFLKNKAKGIDLEKKVKDLASKTIDQERAKLDSTSFSYAISINDNADFIETDSRKDQAVKLLSNLKSSENIEEEEKARRLLDIGEVFFAKGQYKNAGLSFNGAKLKYEEMNLENDPNYYKVLANLGLLYSTMGRYTKSEDFTRKALQKRKDAFGETHYSYGASVNNLAVLQKETGRYNEAEQNADLAVKVLNQAYDNDEMPIAIALNNQAMLYQAMGRYDEADNIIRKAIDISGSLQNKKSNNHQKFLTNQALLYQAMGRYEESEDIFKEVIALKERFFGSNHPDYAHMLSNLASLYMQMSKYDEVEDLLEKARDIYKKSFSDEHRHYAKATGLLGNFYRYQARFDEAEPLLKEALEVKKEALGENHPDYVQAQEDLAILYWKKRDFQKAKTLYDNAIDKSLQFVRDYFPPMSEAEKTKYWDKLRPRFERFYSYAVDASSTFPDLVGKFYNLHISTKGLLLSATSKIKRKILNSGDQDLIDQYLEWLDQKESLARYYSYSKEELNDRDVNLDSLENATNNTERALSRKSDIFQEGYSFKEVDFNEVKSKLQSNEAVVEIVRVRAFENTLTDEVNYIALILKSEDKLPETVILENGKQLETRYFKYYNNTIHQKIPDDYSYDQYFKPIEASIAIKDHIYLSLDGIYNQINLNTLKKSTEAYLIDDYNFTLIGNSKELVSSSKNAVDTKEAYLIGNPDFGGAEITPLPGTEKEIANVSNLLSQKGIQSKVFTLSKASEETIKSVSNPRLLHIATHGYFLEDISLNKGNTFGVNIESARDNPLLRSGLLFAGSAKVLNEEVNNSLESSNNGVLTAYEAMNLNLDQTDLVVLSACETGVGDIKAGEGVYGLQRAFLGAGANAIMMSLWKVDDAATQELMTNFYKNWSISGDKRQAFKKAQLALKQSYKDPYYWGAFLLVGE